MRSIFFTTLIMVLFSAFSLTATAATGCAEIDGALHCGSISSEFKTFQDIPGIGSGELTTADYAKVLFQLAIGAAAVTTVIMLIWAGTQYMLSDVVTSKESAKKTIQNSLLGLLVVLSSVLMLRTINPELTELDFLRNAGEARLLENRPQSAVPGDFSPGQVINIGSGLTAQEIQIAKSRCLKHTNAIFTHNAGLGIISCTSGALPEVEPGGFDPSA